MAGLIGKNEQLSTVTPEASGLLKQLIGFIGQGQGLDQLTPGTTVDKASIQPYLDMFTQQNSRNLAQAKESAGNLTGSGLGSIIGQEAGRANTEQGAFLANLFEQRRQQDANRFLNLVLGSLGSPSAQVQNTYQPGLLDYGGQAFTALASGGAFNQGGLFGGAPKAGATE